jgi:5-methylcytosine-specific restriction protein A
MRTFLFTWNPNIWDWDEHVFRKTINEIEAKGFSKDRWSTGKRKKDLPRGSRFFLLRLGKDPKGIIGSGWTVSKIPYEDEPWNEAHKKDWYVEVKFDALYKEPVIPLNYLQNTSPFDQVECKWTPQTSALEITKVAEALEREWAKMIGRGPHRLAEQIIYPEETSDKASYQEGARKKITINAYERDQEARRACINHYGPRCFICGFSFGKEYPSLPKAEGYIHVHHLVPLSKIGKNYKIDPIKDLRSVCPNCHAALHLQEPPYNIEEMKEITGR